MFWSILAYYEVLCHDKLENILTARKLQFSSHFLREHCYWKVTIFGSQIHILDSKHSGQTTQQATILILKSFTECS